MLLSKADLMEKSLFLYNYLCKLCSLDPATLVQLLSTGFNRAIAVSKIWIISLLAVGCILSPEVTDGSYLSVLISVFMTSPLTGLSVN